MHILHVGVVQTDDEFHLDLSFILPNSGFLLCPGIPVEKYEDGFAVLYTHTKGVQVLQHPVKRFEAEACVRWHKPSNMKTSVGHCLHDICKSCVKMVYT